MAVRIRLAVDGVQHLNATLTRMELAVQDARPAWDEIAKSFSAIESLQFDNRGSRRPARWAPLRPNYAAWKARHYPGKGILEATGDLRRSLTEQPFDIDVRHPHYAIFGTSVPYAMYHQRGTGRMPKRVIVYLTRENRREWTKIIQRHLMGAMEAEG